MTDVQGLAGELGVSGTVIRQAIQAITGSPADDRQLPAELASQVRNQLRSAPRNGAGPVGSPMFSAPIVRPTAARPDSRSTAPAFGAPVFGAPAFGAAAAPAALHADPAKPDALADARRLRQSAANDYAASLASQLADQTATTAATDPWRAAGLGTHDLHLIALCERNGITPEDLRRRVDGQTVASRLKNGESFSSVRSRMQ